MVLRGFRTTVKQFPDVVNVKLGRTFLSDLQSHMSSNRPFVVLDLSNVSRLDKPEINLLLCCLEEAMMLNGDVKLARIPENARTSLRLTGVDRLFEIFDTKTDAISSFRQLHQDAEFDSAKPISAYRDSEYTA